nr:hypothetical transcript [Hymenolepis microstoma]
MRKSESFRKRKQGRREKARVENESKLKEEIRNVKQAYRDKFMEKLSEVQLPNFLADDFNVVSKCTTTDTGGHTVSVEEIDIAQSQYFMGPKNDTSETSAKPVVNDAVPLKKALKMEPKVAKWKKKKINKKVAPYGSNQRRKNLRNAQKLKRRKFST